MNQRVSKEAAKVFSKTINSPKTSFPMFANPAQREKPFLKKCTTNLYAWQIKARAANGSKVWITHDGPPYANGDLHMGHFENKVLKDIINRHKLLSGYRVEYKPGWDCHGLPIELKALQSIASNDKVIDPVEIRKLSRKFASDTIKKQKKSMSQWGIMCDISFSTMYMLEDADKKGCYYTFTKDYELNEIKLFGEMVEKGCIYRGVKPVYWSPQSHTALAEAELEYNDHKSQSVYITFSIQNATNEALNKLLTESPIQALVYTTTPWTLPSNLCLCVHPDADYAVVEDHQKQRYLVMKDRLEAVQNLNHESMTLLLDNIKGLSLQGSVYSHPLFHTSHVMIAGYHVTNDTGTGIVHTAPSHGLDDFQICVYHNIVTFPGMSETPSKSTIPQVTLPPSVPRYVLKEDVDENGCYYATSWIPRLQGKSVLSDGNKEVIQMLIESQHLYHQAEITHRYPFDWRAKTPVIFRLTPQWFINTKQITQDGGIIDKLQTSTIVPSSSYSRLSAMIRDRPDWCISRQRSWGVPIPVVFGINDKHEEIPILSQKNICYIAKVLEEKGVDYWFGDAKEEEFVHPDIRKEGTFSRWKRCRDTLDVWVDSGISWYINYPNQIADVYLEGSDQHRGWFQSSIFTSYVHRKELPFKNLITHGFLVDENGQKMSKSLGNLISPAQLFESSEVKKNNSEAKKQKKPEIPKSLFDKVWPVDVCRLWVASSDYTYDVSLGLKQLLKVQESYQKIRNTNRYLLSNLYDFDPSKDCIPYAQLSFPDKWCLSRLFSVHNDILDAYDRFSFTDVYRHLIGFTVTDLSATYFDIVKDRLYTDAPTSLRRKSTQTVLYQLLQSLPRFIAPVTPFLAEEIFSYSQKDTQKSVFEDGYPTLPTEWKNDSIIQTWNIISELKSYVNRELESLKKQSIIKSGLEVELSIQPHNNEKVSHLLKKVDPEDLADSFICSNVYSEPLNGEVLYEGEVALPGRDNAKCLLQIQKSQGEKCPRCWKYKSLVPLSSSLPPVCTRCQHVLEGND